MLGPKASPGESFPRLVPTNPSDASPKFNRAGDRIFLSEQHRYTRRELWLWFITSPILAWRWSRLSISGHFPLDQLNLPDPTIVIPTGESSFEKGLYPVPPPDAAEFNKRTLDNYLGPPSDDDEWEQVKHLSRRERLDLIDKRPKFDRFGRRIFLSFQRHGTALERILEVVTLPLAMWTSLREVWSWVKAGEEHGWDVAAFNDPTVILPTGRRRYPKEDLLDHKPCPLEPLDGSEKP